MNSSLSDVEVGAGLFFLVVAIAYLIFIFILLKFSIERRVFQTLCLYMDFFIFFYFLEQFSGRKPFVWRSAALVWISLFLCFISLSLSWKRTKLMSLNFKLAAQSLSSIYKFNCCLLFYKTNLTSPWNFLLQLILLVDLEFDYINPYDSTTRINQVILPEFIIQGIFCFSNLIAGHWFIFLISLPCLYYNVTL